MLLVSDEGCAHGFEVRQMIARPDDIHCCAYDECSGCNSEHHHLVAIAVKAEREAIARAIEHNPEYGSEAFEMASAVRSGQRCPPECFECKLLDGE